ncbi:MAG: hypothetical protein IPK16_29175 [Anaerolineales bacterium]|nr:hypothetical protein [Anaerolineales bacterium]
MIATGVVIDPRAFFGGWQQVGITQQFRQLVAFRACQRVEGEDVSGKTALHRIVEALQYGKYKNDVDPVIFNQRADRVADPLCCSRSEQRCGRSCRTSIEEYHKRCRWELRLNLFQLSGQFAQRQPAWFAVAVLSGRAQTSGKSRCGRRQGQSSRDKRGWVHGEEVKTAQHPVPGQPPVAAAIDRNLVQEAGLCQCQGHQ